MRSEMLENLYKRYYNEAKLYVLSLCHSASLADDIVADAFYKAFVSIDEEKASFKFWLLKVCKNCYIDYLRKQKKNTVLEDNMPSANVEPVDGLIKKEEYRALYHALSLLKENYKEVVLLYYFEGLTVSEIAEITEQTVENVKVQMYRARLRLKEILEDKQ